MSKLLKDMQLIYQKVQKLEECKDQLNENLKMIEEYISDGLYAEAMDITKKSIIKSESEE